MMMKILQLLIISILFFSCGSRKKNLNKVEEQTKIENVSNLQQNTSGTTGVSSVTDIKKLLINNNLKIKSNGKDYKLQFGELTFSGNADLELTEKKEEAKIHHLYQTHTTYVTETTYKTHTTYRTEKKNKNLSVNRSGISFGSLLLTILCSLIGGVIIWELLKKTII